MKRRSRIDLTGSGIYGDDLDHHDLGMDDDWNDDIDTIGWFADDLEQDDDDGFESDDV